MNIPNMRKYVGEQMDLLCRKGFYPYEWVDGIDNLTSRVSHLLELFIHSCKWGRLYDGDNDEDDSNHGDDDVVDDDDDGNDDDGDDVHDG